MNALIEDFEQAIRCIQTKLECNNIIISEIKDFRILTDLDSKTGMMFVEFEYKEKGPLK